MIPKEAIDHFIKFMTDPEINEKHNRNTCGKNLLELWFDSECPPWYASEFCLEQIIDNTVDFICNDDVAAWDRLHYEYSDIEYQNEDTHNLTLSAPFTELKDTIRKHYESTKRTPRLLKFAKRLSYV